MVFSGAKHTLDEFNYTPPNLDPGIPFTHAVINFAKALVVGYFREHLDRITAP